MTEYIWNMEEYEKLLQQLEKLSDEGYKRFHSSLLPDNIMLYGVRTPILRELALDIRKGNPAYYIECFYRTFEERSRDKHYYEEFMIAGFVISYMTHNKKGYPRYSFEEVKRYIDDFTGYIDNWAVCDLFCSNLKFKSDEYEAVWKYVKQCVEKKNVYEVRFAVVMMLTHFICGEYVEDILDIIFNIGSEEYYVNMAVAWCASMCYVKYENITDNFLNMLRKRYLSGSITEGERFIFNMTLSKICDSRQVLKERKEYIKGLRLV